MPSPSSCTRIRSRVPGFVTDRDCSVLTTKLDTVVDQVREHLREPAFIRVNYHFRATTLFPKRHVLCRGFRSQRGANFVDQRVQINRRCLELNVSAFDRSELERCRQ